MRPRRDSRHGYARQGCPDQPWLPSLWRARARPIGSRGRNGCHDRLPSLRASVRSPTPSARSLEPIDLQRFPPGVVRARVQVVGGQTTIDTQRRTVAIASNRDGRGRLRLRARLLRADVAVRQQHVQDPASCIGSHRRSSSRPRSDGRSVEDTEGWPQPSMALWAEMLGVLKRPVSLPSNAKARATMQRAAGRVLSRATIGYAGSQRRWCRPTDDRTGFKARFACPRS